MSSTESMCQQSPSLGNFPTGATSAHHFVTPTSSFCAPIAHKMDVALGAREMMRCRLMEFRALTEPSLADRGSSLFTLLAQDPGPKKHCESTSCRRCPRDAYRSLRRRG